MSGVSDAPFRKLAWQFGAGMVVSEMIASRSLLQGRVEMLLKACPADIPLHVVQLAGREAHWMALAAKMSEESGAQIIDINMGCPAKKVTTGYSGSALMKDLDHAMTLVEAVVDAVSVPVTLKMRLGWDHQSINAPELAKRAEDAGIQMITVHGRTRCQFYKGNADWDAVRDVRDAIGIPLVVNGDIASLAHARDAIQASGADAVMIGRGAYGAPWLPAGIGGVEIDRSTIGSELVKQHHAEMLSFYGTEPGIRQARKHLGWYLATLGTNDVGADMKRKLLTSFDPDEVHRLIDSIFEIDSSEFASPKVAA